jgi:hypothetical protein
METADLLMQQALSDNIFPGGVLLVSRDDRIVWTIESFFVKLMGMPIFLQKGQ